MLTVLFHDAAEQPLDGEDRLSVNQILRKVKNCATTRRGIGVQDVKHMMNLQQPGTTSSS